MPPKKKKKIQKPISESEKLTDSEKESDVTSIDEYSEENPSTSENELTTKQGIVHKKNQLKKPNAKVKKKVVDGKGKLPKKQHKKGMKISTDESSVSSLGGKSSGSEIAAKMKKKAVKGKKPGKKKIAKGEPKIAKDKPKIAKDKPKKIAKDKPMEKKIAKSKAKGLKKVVRRKPGIKVKGKKKKELGEAKPGGKKKLMKKQPAEKKTAKPLAELRSFTTTSESSILDKWSTSKRELTSDSSATTHRRSIERSEQLVILSEIQFKNLKNYCLDMLKHVQPPNEEVGVMKLAFYMILQKFEMCLAVQSNFKNKLRELKAELSVERREKKNLHTVLSENVVLTEGLKNDLKNARQQVSEVLQDKHELELIVQSLKEEKVNIISEMDQLRQHSVEGTQQPTMKMREGMLLEHNALKEELENLQKDLSSKESECAGLHKDMAKAKYNLGISQNNFVNVRQKWQEETKKHNRATKELADMREKHKEDGERLRLLTNELNTTKKNLDETKGHFNRLQDENRKTKKDYEIMSSKYEKLKRDFDINEAKFFNVQSQRDDLMKKVQNNAEEITSLKTEVVNFAKQRSRTAKQILTLESYKERAEGKLKRLAEDKQALYNQIEEIKALHVENEVELEECRKENSELTEKIFGHERLMKEIKCEIRVRDETNKNLNHQLQVLCDKLDYYSTRYDEKEMNENRLLRKINDITVKNDELKKCIEEFKSSSAANEKKISVLNQQLDDEARCHQLTKSKLNEFKNKFYKTETRCLDFQDEISRLNTIIEEFGEEDVGNKNNETCYKKLEVNLRRIMNERFHLRRQLERQAEAFRRAKGTSHEGGNETNQLLKELEQKAWRCNNLERQIPKLNEKNSDLKSLLTRKNEKIKVLEEKLDLQNRVSTRGMMEYQERVKDIKLLKREIFYLARGKKFSDKKLSQQSSLKQELVQMEKELMEERLRSKALESEIQNPMNVHRWRLLEGNDPDRYHLIKKNQNLQKRLLNLMIEFDKKDAELKQSVQVNDELKSLLQKQSTLQTVEKTMMYRTRCLKLKEKCQSLLAQVNMYESLCSNYEAKNRVLKSELNELKQSYAYLLKTKQKPET